MAENNDESQLCLDLNLLNIYSAYRNSMDDDLEELMKKMQDGKFSLSEFIKSLITLQTSAIHRIEGSGLQDMSNVLPELQTVNAEFQECEIMFSTIETKLQEKLGQVQKSYEELCKDFKISKSKIATKAKVSSPTLSPVCAAVSAEDVYITDQTPVRDVNRILCNKQTKSEAIADIELNPRLLQTPEFDREYDSPLHTSNLPSARKEHKTPACKSICTFRGTTNKKSHAGNLCSLTSSLVKKKKSVGKALQFQSVPRMNVVGIYNYHVVFA
ncbi:hypothetical protein B7P43_G18240 [Cryptotermes secundus]|uniref:Uncharacterized protein n=1 Tax=Cryptotermes secundus TaxID=105785 RepID=A0A2J7PTA6_9NEOP|nr:hypothetical protein B7P43_G18240 [Cryptotermes secundus]